MAYSKYSDLRNSKENILSRIPNICLKRTKKFIAKEVESNCYYDFIITRELILLERKPNSFILKELPIIINRTTRITNHQTYHRHFNIKEISKNKNGGLVLELSSINYKLLSIEISINKSNNELEEWLIK